MKKGMELWKAEWKAIFKSKLAIASLVAVCFIPIIYAGTYLAAFWDPYGKLDSLPVAVVNLDKGADFNGEKLAIGDEFVNKLKENTKFKWKFVSEEKAEKGINDKQYYMMVTIPEDFSENAATVMDENPKQMKLIYTANEGFNFLSAQIGSSAIEVLKEEISKTVTKSYVEEMLASLTEIGDGMQTAAEGSTKLSDGLASASEGSSSLENGLETFTSKLQILKDGLSKAKDGNTQVASGLVQLNDSGTLLINGLKQYADGSGQLAYNLGVYATKIGSAYDGAKQVENGISSLEQSIQAVTIPEPYATNVSNALKQLKSASQAVSTGLDTMNTTGASLSVSDASLTNKLTAIKDTADKTKAYASAIPTGLTALQTQASALLPSIPEPNRTLLANGISTLISGSSQVDAGLGQLSKAAEDLGTASATFAEKTTELNTGSANFLSGLNQATAGANQLQAGSSQLEDGSSQLLSGSKQLKDGSTALLSGLAQLNDGGKELSDKLSSGSAEIQSSTPGEKSVDMMASPVKAVIEPLNEVPDYGTGLSPYFIALGLFVGGIVLTVIFQFREPIGAPKSGWSLFVSKFGVVAVASIIQSIIISLIMLVGLNLEVKNLAAFLITVFVSSITFVSLVYMFTTLFDDVGRFILVLLLIMQLTTSAGTFPIELVPDFFQVFHPLLPMTYSVSALKDAISIGDLSIWMENLSVLLAFLVASVGISIAFLNMKVKAGFGSTDKAVAK